MAQPTDKYRFLALTHAEVELLETVLDDEIANLLAEDTEAGRSEPDDMTNTLIRLQNRALRIIAKFEAQEGK